MTSVQSDFDTFINIYRRRENILYSELYDANHAAVAYIRTKEEEPRASDDISVVDKSSSLVSNRVETFDPIVVENSSSYNFETDQVLITDQILTFVNNVKVPLFWQHIISTENLSRVSSTDYTISTGITLSDVKILNKDFEEVDALESGIDFNKGLVYNNLQNNVSNPLRIYYIKYTVRSGTDIFTYTEILNNQEIYTVATFDDLDENLNIINDGRKVYIINRLSENFEIVLPEAGTYGFQILSRAKIKILPFDDLDFTFSWFPRISNGNFFTTVEGQKYRYYIGQFESQSWNPNTPYKKVDAEISKYISPNLFRLNRDKVQSNGSQSMYLDVLVNDQDDNGLIAFTTNPSLHGSIATNNAIYYYYSFSTKIGIRSIDYLNGLVDIEGYELESTYNIYSTYYFEEEDFEFDDIDLNPINNPDILNQRLVLFIVPDLDDIDDSKTLYYLLVDKTSQVIQSDWPSFSNINQLTTEGNRLFYQGRPSFISAVSGDETFASTYAIEGSGNYLVLGEMTVESSVSIKDVTTRDARVPGGGLIESTITAAKQENPEVIWYWDIGKWDGEFYPGNASFYIEVPVSVLSDAGGTFTQKQVRDVVEKHTAFGVYPLIKAYGVDPYIKDVEPSTNSIYLEWYSYGSDKLYNIYYSQKKDGPWTKATSSPISDISTGNSYTIGGLSSGVYYYIIIVGGILDSGNFLAQCGQAIGPVEDGAKTVYGLNVAKVKTR
jgi:hypothetical protein